MFPNKISSDQKVNEKVLNITNHQENANRNHDDHTYQMAVIKKTTNDKCQQ